MDGKDAASTADFDRVRIGRADAWVRRDFRDAFETMNLADPAYRPPPEAARYRGRAEVFSLAVPGGEGRRAVVRFLRHGGLSGLLFGGWFAGPSRAFRELALTRSAMAAGVPTAAPLAAVTFRRLGLFYRAVLVTEEIEGGRDLAARLETTPVDRACARASARAVRRMHDAGFRHADLNLKNVLVREAGETLEAYIVDWDLARRSPRPLSRRARLGNLMRLDRSARKTASRGLPVPLKEKLRFLKHYFAPPGSAPPTRAALRRWALLARIHAVAWFLFP